MLSTRLLLRVALTRPTSLVLRRTLSTTSKTTTAKTVTAITAITATAITVAAGVGLAYSESSWYNPLSWFALSGTPSSKNVDYEALKKDVEELVLDKTCGPLLVRLAWHASGTYDAKTNTGGSNGSTMRYALESNDGANAGLDIARNLLEPLKKKYPGVTYADLWTYAGKVAIEYMGCTVEIPWKPGRVDYEKDDKAPPNGRLPDATQGAQHLRDVFYRMGFNDQEIVALSGAHTLGECHRDRSGFVGPWTRDPNGFDNDYFRLLLSEKWVVKKNFQPLQYVDATTGELMMLPTDMALIWDPKFRVWVEKYAKDQDLWHKDFAVAFGKLLDLGVPRK